jgi:alpha-tubulin suppressor-like RCC1 family protein
MGGMRGVWLLALSVGCASPPTTTDRPTAPVPSVHETAPEPDTAVAAPIEALAAGGHHTCLLRGGEVYCWGKDTDGQIGDGSRATARPPTRVDGLVEPVRLGLGFEHSCAVERSGRVMCWGNNVSRQLGSDPPDATRPAPVDGLAKAIDVVGGRTHGCALLGSGRVVCWGVEHNGELGRDGGDDRAVVGVEDAVAISAKQGHTCVITRTRQVLCWGGHWVSGFFGDEHRLSRSRATAVPGLEGSEQIAVGAEHVCGLLHGEVRCYSANVEGQLGDPAAPCCKPTVAKVPHIVDAVQITAGFWHTCALRRVGDVLCWGVPFAVEGAVAPPPPGLSQVVEIAAGDEHVCARRRRGGILCWGDDGSGQLGGAPKARITKPTPVAGVGVADALTVGFIHGCARAADGHVFCWSPWTEDGKPVAVPPLDGHGILESGVYETCVLRPHGPVHCMGRAPVPFDVPPGVLDVPSDAEDLVVGGAGICVRTTTGDVACVPEHSDAHRIPGPLPNRTARAMKGLRRTRLLAVGMEEVCALGKAGMQCMKEDSPLTFPAPDDRGWARPERMRGLDRLDVAELELGNGFGCARLANGTVRAWGANGSGQLGDGTLEARSEPVAVAGLTNVVELAAGNAHACARLVDGTVWCWGDSAAGQTGRESLEPLLTPTRVDGITDAVEIGAGSASSCARTKSGQILCWGDNTDGRLGVGQPTRAALPETVSGLP